MQEENRPIHRIDILRVDADLDCVLYDDRGNVAGLGGSDVYVEHDDRMQEFERGRKIVLNGIRDIDVRHCTDLREKAESRSNLSTVKETVNVNYIKYNKTVLDAGRPVASSVERCELYQDYEPGSRFGPAGDMVNHLYEECWEIREAMRWIG